VKAAARERRNVSDIPATGDVLIRWRAANDTALAVGPSTVV